MKFSSRLFSLALVVLLCSCLDSKADSSGHAPYRKPGFNDLYNMLFCDGMMEDQKERTKAYPFNILSSEKSKVEDLQKIIDDPSAESRTKVLAYRRLNEMGHKSAKKELLGVIVEVGMDEGLDVMAAYKDGSARFISCAEKMVVWEAVDDPKTSAIIGDLLAESQKIVDQIGPWDQARKAYPRKAEMRISFLVSDELYFGEGPEQEMFTDPAASPTLTKATELMVFLTQKSLEEEAKKKKP